MLSLHIILEIQFVGIEGRSTVLITENYPSNYLKTQKFVNMSSSNYLKNQKFVKMPWSEIMAKMNHPPKKVIEWVCSKRIMLCIIWLMSLVKNNKTEPCNMF